MSNRPYMEEKQKKLLEDGINTFSQNRSAENKEKTRGKDISISDKDISKTRKEIIFIVISVFLIFICVISSLCMLSKTNELTRMVSAVETENQLLSEQNEYSENIILTDIDGLDYREYATEVLGMNKVRNNQYVFVNTENFKEKYKKEKNIIFN